MNGTDGSYLRTLFLHPPSYDGFDGGAGARYQARREIRSFWYPTWLAQPAALVPDSRLVDAPPAGLTLADITPLAHDYELCVIHTSTPSFAYDVKVAEALKAANPRLRVGFVGAHVAVQREAALRASPALEFVAGNEFDFTIQEVAHGRPLAGVRGLSYRVNGHLARTPERPPLEDMDALPFVVDVYRRDLVVEQYIIGYLLHPYVSLYTGRGCRSRCTFCLWPQTVGGQRYRTRSVDHVVAEIARARQLFPQVKEYFFDDDTFTDDLPRAEAIARGLGKLGVTWSCNAKANVPQATLQVLRDNGLRLLLVGYESGNQTILNNVKKGIRLEGARQFTKHAKALGIKIHGTFILGLPGETRETIEETIRFARDIDPDTVQVSIAAPYPGTELYRQAVTHGWLTGTALVDDRGAQVGALSYPHLMSSEVSRGTAEFYRRFYFRPRKLFAIGREMIVDRRVLRRRLGEGREFLGFLASRRHESHDLPAAAVAAAVADAARGHRLQVVLSVSRRPPMIASLPAALRIAHELARTDSVGRVLVCTESPAILRRWQRRFAALPSTTITLDNGSSSIAGQLDPDAPALVLAENGIPDPRQLQTWLDRCRAEHRPTAWVWQGAPVATYYPTAKCLVESPPGGSGRFAPEVLAACDTSRVPAPSDAWADLSEEVRVRRVEHRLLRSLRRPSDGYLARWDRALSIGLSRLLIRMPITPNAITAFSLVVSLAGAALLAAGTWGIALVGTLLLWSSCILDGCDGEVARLKLLTSPFGARFDTLADNLSHLATFAAISLHLHRVRPDLALAGPAALLLLGVLVSMGSVWWFVDRHPAACRTGFDRVYERIASRDYIYAVVVLTAVGRLDWFVWSAGVGANVFWLSLWLSTRSRSAR